MGNPGLILLRVEIPRPSIRALHWMLTFPLAEILRVLALTLTAQLAHSSVPDFSRALCLFALCTLLLTVPAPYMAYVAGTDRGPWDFDTMILVALRREFGSPWPWFSPLHLTLAFAALAAYIAVHRHAFSMRGHRAWKHFLSAAINYVMACVTLAAVAAIPVRLLLE